MEEECKPGAPMWIVTFADLMSLLMSFFVMLMSFASMDAMKFKQVADSLEKAFGVQRETTDMDPPKGTNKDFKHFSPGKPENQSTDSIKQDTTHEKSHLETFSGERELFERLKQESDRQITQALEQLERELVHELASGQLEIEKDGERLVVRIQERGSFPSGSADFAPPFKDVVTRITGALSRMPGTLAIEGHTDDIPMKSQRFRSNWELSSARAAAVATAILHEGSVEPERIKVSGFAETKPRAPNENNENRAQNRRVEIVIDLSSSAADLRDRAKELIEGGRDDLVPELGWE